MRTTVVTGMWGDAWQRYGARFFARFLLNWPVETELIIGADRDDFGTVVASADRPVRILRIDEISVLTDWLKSHKHNPVARGKREAAPGTWKKKERALGYSWRHDAYRWVRQAVIPIYAAEMLPDGEALCWLDADVVTHEPVPRNFVPHVLQNKRLAYLGRAPKHSEIGFWACVLDDRTRRFMSRFANIYLSDSFLEMPQSHSAFCFDAARAQVFGADSPDVRDLTPGGSGHVWFQSELGNYMDHEKGARKGKGSAQARSKGWSRK